MGRRVVALKSYDNVQGDSGLAAKITLFFPCLERVLKVSGLRITHYFLVHFHYRESCMPVIYNHNIPECARVKRLQLKNFSGILPVVCVNY